MEVNPPLTETVDDRAVSSGVIATLVNQITRFLLLVVIEVASRKRTHRQDHWRIEFGNFAIQKLGAGANLNIGKSIDFAFGLTSFMRVVY